MSAEPVFSYHGAAVRLAARRPNGLVLVEYLSKGDHRPLGSWREVDAQVLRSRLSPQRQRELITVLPEVAFVGDAKPEIVAGVERYWWQERDL